MDKILLVSEAESFMVMSLTKQLNMGGYEVLFSKNDPNELAKVKEELRLILVYAEELDMEGAVYIKDKVIEEGLPVFLIGDVNQIDDLKKLIPAQFIKKVFFRPINVKDVADVIEKYIKEDVSHLKKKILVVDDSGVVLRNVKGWLEDKYQVILANSGAMAIKYLAMNHPDLILLDYEMPICDGRQVLEMIRAESDYEKIPVFFLTGKNDKESVLSVTNLKPEGYLLKTMEPQQIVGVIDEFFEKNKGAL